MVEKGELKEQQSGDMDWFHTNWPLGGSAHAIQTTEFEWSAIRFFSAFERSCLQLSITAGAPEMTFQELVVLHVIGMQHHPQGSSALARQLNRDDVPNLQYTLRKMEKRRLIEKCSKMHGKTALYELASTGRATVDRYATIREKLLNGKTGLVANIDERLEDASRLLAILTGIYDDVARAAATYRPLTDTSQDKNSGG